LTHSQGNVEGSYRVPSFEHARVADAMRPGLISCAPETPLETVARMMATNHVHSIVVTRSAGGAGRPWGIVSDIDLVRVAGDAEDRTAGETCQTEVVSVGPDDTLRHAAQLMAKHGTGHLLVVDPQRGEPVGVLSTLDVAGVVAWARG